MRKTVSR
jgi:hypothetical protein